MPKRNQRTVANRPRPMRRPFRTEQLESRLLLTNAFELEILAQTGKDQITTIQPSVSINDRGQVAFAAGQNAGVSLFVADGVRAPRPISFEQPSVSRSYGAELQINNRGQVAAVDVAEARRTARIWDSNEPGSHTDIASSLVVNGTPDMFSGMGNFASISNDGYLSFAGLENPDAGPLFWEVHQSDAFVDRRDGANPGETEAVEITLPPSVFLRQSSADDNRVVVGTRQRATAQITRYDATQEDAPVLIASTEDDAWTNLGVRASVSDDGRIVVFAGDSTKTGSGIYASITTDEGQVLQQIASLEDGFTSFEIDSRVSVTNFRVNKPFATVVFAATRTGKKGIYTSRISLRMNANSEVNLDAPDGFDVSQPIAVTEVEDSIFEDTNRDGVLQASEEALPGTVTNLAVHDAVASVGSEQIAYWVTTSTGTQAVVLARPRAGDANGDGQVSFADFLILSSNFGQATDVTFADGDFDLDGRVAFSDFLLLSSNFGKPIA